MDLCLGYTPKYTDTALHGVLVSQAGIIVKLLKWPAGLAAAAREAGKRGWKQPRDGVAKQPLGAKASPGLKKCGVKRSSTNRREEGCAASQPAEKDREGGRPFPQALLRWALHAAVLAPAMTAGFLRFPVPPLPRSRLAWLWASAAAAAIVVALGAAAAWQWRRGRRSRRQLVRVGTVSGVVLYPVKSCRGFPVERAQVTPLGLRCGDLRDRFWLVIKEDGHMVTARQEPRLVLITVNSKNGHIVLTAPEMKELTIPIKLPKKNSVKNCRVFGLDIEGRDCGDEVAHWFTNFLNSEPYRLVQFETNMAPRKCEKIKTPFRATDEVPYSDCGPLLIISEASMEDLNTRLEKKVDLRNFRPSITVSGCGPYEEDTWDKIMIGDVELKLVMQCGRCILTTVDPDTGIIDRKEPLETLKSYRMPDPALNHIYKSAPLFGSFFGVDKIGTIQVGDPVYKIIEY